MSVDRERGPIFYVYENWTRDHGRIHRAACPNCNHGLGVQPNASRQHGKWHGPFPDRQTAFAFAASLNRKSMAPCKKCQP